MRFTIHPSPADQTNLVSKEGKVMVFRTSAEDRRMGILMTAYGFILFIICPLLMAVMLGKPVLYLGSVLGTCSFLFSLYIFAGPNDICLDGDERVYERKTGWPWKPTRHRGTFEDIIGVCVSPRGSALLLIKKPWQPGQPYETVVLSSSTSAAAQTMAEDVSSEFGFPIVPYPK